MKVNGEPIDGYALKPLAATITYSLAFEEEEARIASGLSYDEYQAMPGTPEWINPLQPSRSKCDVLIWYRMHLRIPAVSQDAQARKMEREAKMRKLGR